MKQLIRYLIWFLLLFAGYNSQAQNNTVYGAGISYTNGAPTWTPNPRTSRAAVDTITGRWYHFNTPGGWQWIGNTVEEIAGCAAPAYTPSKGDSRLVINNCVKPQVYWYDGLTWKWINEGTTYFAGEGIRIENDTIILDSLYVLRFRTGDTTDLNAGAVSWNAGEQTLDVVINQGAVTGQMFLEVLYFTKNQTGAQIDDGTVVMAAGTSGNSGKILIAPAIADGSVNSEYILGLATQNLPNGGEGMVTHFGKVRGIQTNGANYGETWVDGDVLYCSAVTPGYLTKVLPTAPNLKVPIAIVIHAHPSNGTLFVRPSHFPDLAQINDVQLSSPTNGQVLTYNSTLSRWENATPADPSATNELQTLSTGTNTLTLSNGGGTVTVDTDPTNDVTGSGTSGQVSFWTGAQTQSGDNGLFWDNAAKRLGVGLADPSVPLEVRGTTTTDGGQLGSELLTSSNWTTTGWTGDFISGFNHTTGNTSILSNTLTAVIGTYYQISWVVTNRTAGTFTVAFGGQSIGNQSTTNNFGPRATTTGNLTITPTTDFNGTIVISIRTITAGTATFRLQNSAGAITNEIRSLLSNENVAIGVNAGSRITTGRGNTFIGQNAGSNNTTGIVNVFIGQNAGSVNTTGRDNIFIAGGANNTSGSNNIFIGTQAGNSNTTGNLGTFIGFNSGFNNTTGSQNTFLGYQAGFSNTTGSNNTFFGYQAAFGNTGGNNSFFGVSAGNSATGNGNIGFGFFAGSNSQSGSNNVFLGREAGRYFTGGSSLTTVNSSVFIGFDTRAAGNSETNQIVIGHQSIGLGSNTTVLGNSSTTQTWLGGSLTLGTQVAPAARLHVVGSGTSSSTWTAQFHNSAGNNNALMIRDDGRVAMGTNAPNASAILTVTSTTGGILFPRMTTTERNAIATPADGLVIYNTTDNKLQVRAGGAWVDLH